MKNLVSTYVDQFRQDRQKQLRLAAVLAALAVVVAGIVFWQLHSTGVAMTNETFCGMEEHTHGDDCYEEVLICDSDDEDHVHGDECYARTLVCDKVEHTHTIECMIDENADLETAADWEATLPVLTGNQAYDVVSIAQSQVGYSESEANFQLADDGVTRQGYTRYGEWYGNAYGDWDAMFASFCLNYADVSETEFPESSGVYAWMTDLEQDGLLAESGFTPSRGDLVFLDADQNGEADTVAVVTGVDDGVLTVIQGNSNDVVEQYEIGADASGIVAYGILPAQEDAPEVDFEVLDHMTQTIAEEEASDENTDDFGIATLADGTGEVLDGDYAYLTNVGMDTGSNENGYAMTTGTSPWDTTEGAGNDTTELDSVLRTYDTATYTVDMTTIVRDDAPNGIYVKGDLYFEFLVEGKEDEVRWETGSMGWLESKYGVYTETEEEYNGKTYQVLRGYITLEPGTGEGHAIGNTTQSLTLALRVLSMKNGDTVAPEFTFFLAYNDVGLSDAQYADWGTSDYDGPMITFDGQACQEHGTAEYQTITAPEITVSAAPRYNLYVTEGESADQVVSGFDFSTGNGYAMNQDAGDKYGRLAGYGLELQIVGKNSTSGLRGVEIPKNGEKINATFTIDLTSEYTASGETYKTDGTTYDTAKVKTEDGSLSDYAPLIWSFEANSWETTQRDGRSIPFSTKYVSTVPYNKLPSGGSNTWYYYCDDGGVWAITDKGNGKYEVTITDCVVNMDQLPYNNPKAGSSTPSDPPYYNPNSINYDPSDPEKNDYWEVETAVIASGECWVLQPFYAHEKTADTGADSTYIAQVVDEGTFNAYLKDTALEITDSDGNTLLKGVDDNSNQGKLTDDQVEMSMALLRPGDVQEYINYLKYDYAGYTDSLVDGCYDNGKDWILQGNKLTIGGFINNDSAEGENTAVAYDALVKFDDVFFVPDGTVTLEAAGGGNDYETVILWAAKSNGKGWDHQGLEPDESGYDEEMILATTDDLIFYSSLEALQNDNKICVGVLIEYRGPMTEQMNHMHYYIKGSTTEDAETNQVYMVSHYARVWNKENLAATMAEDRSSEYYGDLNDALNAILTELTADEVRGLAQKYIPSRADNDVTSYDKDYPSTANTKWINGGRDGTSDASNNIRNYKKAYYTENGFDGNGTGVSAGPNYGDSCLLVGYDSGLSMRVAQQTGSGGSKRVFDMDTDQTVVDYEISPFLAISNVYQTSESTTTTDVVVTVTLPDELTYIYGSSYIGGTYETTGEGKQGTVTGGTQLVEGVATQFTYTVDSTDYTVGVTLIVDEAKGTLTYSFTNVPVLGSDAGRQLLDDIYFSCEISSGAVYNEEELDVKSSIYCTEDKEIDLDLRENGEAVVGITVTKAAATSLVKTADQAVVEVNELIGYTIDIGDNSDNSMTMVAVDNIPYNDDDNGSSLINDKAFVYVTEFSAYDTTSTRDLSGFYFFYTTSSKFAGVTSADYPEGEYFVTDLGESNEAVNPDCLADGWVQMDMNSSQHDSEGHTIYSYTGFPQNEQQVYAIIGIGIIEGHDDINMHVTLDISDQNAGDVLVNRVTQQHGISTDDPEPTYVDLSDTARTRVVGRKVSGYVWLDEDLDGGIDTGKYQNEQMLNGVTVELQKKTGDSWETAEKLKYADGESADCITATDENGYYEFTYVSEGTFRIVFSGAGTRDYNGGTITYMLSDHDVTIYEADGISDENNSKVIRQSLDISPNSVTYYDDESSLDCISGIEFPDAASISGLTEYSYQNAGYTKNVPFTVNKEWKDTNGNDITDSKLTGSVKVKITAVPEGTTTPIEIEAVLDPSNDWTYIVENLPYYNGNGLELDYKTASFSVEEIEGNDGYTVTVGDIIQNGDGDYSVTVTNQAGTEMPYTGGSGTWMYTAGGMLLIAGAAAVLVYRKRRAVNS